MVISIVIITYNSERFVLDCLESAKEQTYRDIELIISDDCSTDKTIEICNKWLEKNRNRFLRTEVIASELNTGVSANCNRGIKACNGEWVKLIAGDDILLEDCIKDNLNYVISHGNVNYLYSNLLRFKDWNGETETLVADSNTKMFFSVDASQQLELFLTLKLNFYTPSLFCRRSLFEIYPFDENYKYIEDQPHILHLLKNGIKLDYMDQITVKYRISENLSLPNKNRFYNPKMFESYIPFCYMNLIPELQKRNNTKKIQEIERLFFRYYIAICVFKNKNNTLSRLLMRILFKLVGK